MLAKVEWFSTVSLMHSQGAEEVDTIMATLLRRLISQDRAIANARAAATRQSRCRIERSEVELFLEDLAAKRSSRTA